jgi:lysine 2,3-aminomutase
MSKSLKPLQTAGLLTDEDAARLTPVAERYSIGLSASLMNMIRRNPDGPVARQYMPDERELETTPGERSDPIGDDTYSPVRGIVHRYPNRVLLMPLETCAVYCRFCFRRENIGQDGHGLLSTEDLAAALGYIRDTPAIREVILTGGDPMVLSERRLGTILEALNDIDHVRIIRIHTRLPVADPDRLADGLYAVLARSGKPVYVALHINHADEITPAMDKAFARLRRAGCILLSQTVLLKDVNDSVDALADLFQALVERGVKPYYLHHPDMAPGTSHFRVAPAVGQEIVRVLRGRISGLGMPTYVLDIPGGYGKVPIAASHLARTGNGLYTVLDIHGRIHDYDPDVADKPENASGDKDAAA